AGAAGGLGAGLMAFVNAQLESGIDIVTNTVKLVEQLKGVDLVVTGEGYLDQQTIHGKTPVGVARIAQKQNIPVIAVAGGIQGNPAGLYQQGITSMMDITPAPIPLCQAMNQTILFLEQSSERIARLLKIGGSLFAK
ncbi:glycerate kinase, partial [Candidatus Poribacteria bacterium]|nr:glycerate kinase [Candidatus Poribacteria bacterium]